MNPIPLASLQNDGALESVVDRAALVEQLLDIGTALSAVRDLGELLDLILSQCRRITCSDAGSVYLIDREEGPPKMLFKVAQNDSQPDASFKEFAMPLTRRSLAGYVALTGESLNIPDAYHLPPDVPYQFNYSFDTGFAYRTRSVLVLPMQNREGQTLGVLQLINRKIDPDVEVTPWNATDAVQPYSSWEERITRSLASQAAISIERNHLQESIKQLFEGFVKASVQAIEARDPCTSGHSERVAALTVRLAQETNAIAAGPLSALKFDRDQLQAIRYASLLHDFGKVGVPEAILVKRKKLYDHQLEIVRQRFALAQRTLEMECSQLKLRYLLERPEALQHNALQHHALQHHALQHEMPHDSAAPSAAAPPHDRQHCPCCQQFDDLERDLSQAVDRLGEYWQLLLKANEPCVLAEEPLNRLQELAGQTYRDVDGKLKPLVTPEELAQLLVAQGTLTAEERAVIQSHVSHTYEFLKRIPWTESLKAVPEIAHGHHEKLDGTGYPRGLAGDDIPVAAQMMAVADIYDALTAGDRPYKRRILPTTALGILREEARKHRVRAEFVDLFEQRRVFEAIGHDLADDAGDFSL